MPQDVAKVSPGTSRFHLQCALARALQIPTHPLGYSLVNVCGWLCHQTSSGCLHNSMILGLVPKFVAQSRSALESPSIRESGVPDRMKREVFAEEQ